MRADHRAVFDRRNFPRRGVRAEIGRPEVFLHEKGELRSAIEGPLRMPPGSIDIYHFPVDFLVNGLFKKEQ